ncbi:hypothetical protein BU17DRAFT_68338 [Hysterangium stoloniferum]|nr:hypothetical protein BU17DRAFT_68338 [Hysterangium stoloniferum]
MRARRSFSNTAGDGSEEPLMGDEARKALLGKEDAEAVGRNEDVVEVVMENGFMFWNAIESEMVNNDLIAFLRMKFIGEDTPFFMLLNRFLDDKGVMDPRLMLKYLYKARCILSESIYFNGLWRCLEYLIINSAVEWVCMSALSTSESNINYPPNPLLRGWILDVPFSVTGHKPSSIAVATTPNSHRNSCKLVTIAVAVAGVGVVGMLLGSMKIMGCSTSSQLLGYKWGTVGPYEVVICVLGRVGGVEWWGKCYYISSIVSSLGVLNIFTFPSPNCIIPPSHQPLTAQNLFTGIWWWRVTMDNKKLKCGHWTCFWCSQDEAHKKWKSSTDPNIKNRENPGMKRFPCHSKLGISCCNVDGDGSMLITVRLEHHHQHINYVEVSMPLEALQMICDHLEWLTPTAIVTKIQAVVHNVTRLQIHTAWSKMSEVFWH